MKMLCIITLLFLTAQSVFGQSQDKSPSLDTTLTVMQNTLAQYGYIHTSGKDQELTIKKNEKEPCRLYVEWEITYEMHTLQDGVYPTEYQLHLGTIDPDSVKVVIDDRQKNKPEGWKLIKVHLVATDNDSVIYMSASNWDTNDIKVPETLRLSSRPDFDFQFRDKEQAGRFAKALKHAVTLCGGKPSAF